MAGRFEELWKLARFTGGCNDGHGVKPSESHPRGTVILIIVQQVHLTTLHPVPDISPSIFLISSAACTFF
jgi:hypothetical protein